MVAVYQRVPVRARRGGGRRILGRRLGLRDEGLGHVDRHLPRAGNVNLLILSHPIFHSELKYTCTVGTTKQRQSTLQQYYQGFQMVLFMEFR